MESEQQIYVLNYQRLVKHNDVGHHFHQYLLHWQVQSQHHHHKWDKHGMILLYHHIDQIVMKLVWVHNQMQVLHYHPHYLMIYLVIYILVVKYKQQIIYWQKNVKMVHCVRTCHRVNEDD